MELKKAVELVQKESRKQRLLAELSSTVGDEQRRFAYNRMSEALDAVLNEVENA